MGELFPRLRGAVAQAAPIYLNRDATIDKACRIIEEAGDNGAKVLGFPECFVPAFPDWYWFYPAPHPIVQRCNVELFKNAVVVPSAATEKLGAAARRAGIYVVIGVDEKEPNSYGTMYNSLLFFGPDGALLGRRRKIVPTWFERMVHTGGDGSTLQVFQTPYGGLSGLICGENTNSLARFALLAGGDVIHVASWPAFALRSDAGSHEAIDIRVRAMAYEGRIFVLSSTGIFSEEMKDVLELDEAARSLFDGDGGHSTIVGPLGRIIAGPLPGERILYADLDLEQIVSGKLIHDITGHYNRFDIFSLRVDRRTRQGLQSVDDGQTSAAELQRSPTNEVTAPTRRPELPEAGISTKG